MTPLADRPADVKVRASVFADDAFFTPMNDRAITALSANAPDTSIWRFGVLSVPRPYSSWLIEALVEEGITISRA